VEWVLYHRRLSSLPPCPRQPPRPRPPFPRFSTAYLLHSVGRVRARNPSLLLPLSYREAALPTGPAGSVARGRGRKGGTVPARVPLFSPLHVPWRRAEPLLESWVTVSMAGTGKTKVRGTCCTWRQAGRIRRPSHPRPGRRRIDSITRTGSLPSTTSSNSSRNSLRAAPVPLRPPTEFPGWARPSFNF
jgi:hypothetical protein